MLQKQKIKYQDGNILLEGYCAIDTNIKGKRPAVLVAHDWSGRNEFADKRAERLAELGYVGFALDMYGNGKVGKTKEEKTELMNPLTSDRAALLARIQAAFDEVKKMPEVDTARMGAIGFCFGGLCALDLARSGADVKGVVSFHGALNKPEKMEDKKIVAKVLAIHGYDDPLVTADHVSHFEKEMTQQKVDWQLLVYGGTMHGFTNPLANDPGFGTVYSERADKRSWLAMKSFFEEVFGA